MVKQADIDINTLELLPVAILLFDNQQVYFVNQKAIDLLEIPKSFFKTKKEINLYHFIDKSFHKRIKENNNKILKGSDFPAFELPCISYKKKELLLKVKSNSINYKGKKIIQSTFFDVTDKIESNQQLEKANLLLQKFSNNINDIIFEQSFIPYPHIKYISNSVTKILGRTPQEVYENPHIFLESIHPDDQKNYVTSLQSYLKISINKKISKLVFRYKHANGKLMYLESAGTPVIKNKKVVGVVGVIRDVTNEQQSKLLMNQKWTNYENLIETSPIGILIHQGICYYANQAAALILEIDNPKKLIGKQLLNFFIPQQQERASKRVSLATEGNVQENLIYTIQTAKGNFKEVELKTVPFVFNGNTCVQTIITDISAEKKLEDERLRLKLAESSNKVLVKVINARKAAEAKLDAVFNTSSHIIWTVDADFKLSSFNQNYYHQINDYYHIQPAIGIDYKGIYKKAYSKQKYTYWINQFKEAFTGKNLVFEIEKCNEKNEPIYCEVFLNPIYNDNGKIVEIAAISHNITDRKIQEQEISKQTTKLNTVFNTSSHIIWTVDKNYKLSSFNKNYFNQVSTFYKSKVKVGLDFKAFYKSILNTEDYNLWMSNYSRAFKGENILFQTEKKQVNKPSIYREIYLNPSFNDKGEVVEIVAISHNITDRKIQEQKIEQQAAKLKAIFESGNQLLWTVNRKNVFTSFNQNFSDAMTRLYKVKPNQTDVYQPHKTKQNKAYHQWWIDKYKQVFETSRSTEFTTEQIDGDKKHYRQIFLHPIFNSSGLVDEISCTSNDITELKYLQHQSANQSARLKSIFESGNQLMWTITKDLKLTSFNKNYANAVFDLYQFYPEIGKTIREISGQLTTPYEPLWDEKYNLVFSGKQIDFTTNRITVNGKQVYRQYYLYPIRDENNQVIEVSGLGFDVTENKINEEKLKQSLKEKEVLLKEVHHRVKNNMQVISSILNLQSSYVKDDYALSLLKESQNRIKSMSFIHESLYQTKNFELVNFSDYLITLSKNLVHTYSVNTEKIKLELNLCKLFLNLDTSIPCGLIINEIISNSLKYAFPNNRKGTIFINLSEKDKTIYLEIGDNGIGIPNNIDIKNTDTLGLQLVDTLIEQINAKLHINKTKGTIFNLEFKIP